jgi:hypothetical protein
MLSVEVGKQLTDLTEDLINKSKSSANTALLFCATYSKSKQDTKGGGRTRGYSKGGGVELDVLWWKFKLFIKRVGTYLHNGLKIEPCHISGRPDPLSALIRNFERSDL